MSTIYDSNYKQLPFEIEAVERGGAGEYRRDA